MLRVPAPARPHPVRRHRPTLLGVLLAMACAGPSGPGPQEATFPPGQRIARGDQVALELAAAHYDLRQVSLQVTVTNRGDTPLALERQGILLAYGELEFPVSEVTSPTVKATTVVPPGEVVKLELGFVMEQALVKAATLHVLSIRRGQGWVEPLRLAVPPPAAFVQAAAQPDADP